MTERIPSLKPQWYQLKTGLSMPLPLILISPAYFLNLVTNFWSMSRIYSAYLYKLKVTSSYWILLWSTWANYFLSAIFLCFAKKSSSSSPYYLKSEKSDSFYSLFSIIVPFLSWFAFDYSIFWKAYKNFFLKSSPPKPSF